MDRPRLTVLLASAVVGTYFLIALGTTTAATGMGGALRIAHSVAAIGVGCLLVAAAVEAWAPAGADRRRSGRIRWVLAAALAGYPVQAVGGLSLAAGRPLPADRLHLIGGILVFAALLVGLVRQLEAESGARTGGTGDGSARNAPSSERPSRRPDPPSRNPGPRSRWETVRRRCGAYVALTKPRLMWLLCLLALAGMGLAATATGRWDGPTIVATLSGGVLAIGAAGTFNHVYERDRDREMSRTSDRPVATDRVPPGRATLFGIVLAASSTGILLAFVNPLATALTLAAVVYYSVVYTVVLKPTTRWNTVIGGGAGALPAVIGYAAIADGVGPAAVALAAVVFCWTPAHFYNLAIAHRTDYELASYPMLPVVRGVAVTRRRILFWLGTTLLASGLLGAIADLGPAYAVTSAALGGVFVLSVVRQYRLDTARAAVRSFHASNLYLGGVLLVIVLESVPA